MICYDMNKKDRNNFPLKLKFFYQTEVIEVALNFLKKCIFSICKIKLTKKYFLFFLRKY